MFKDREYYNMITESWKLFKKYLSQVEADSAVMEKDDWWQALIDEGEQLAKKYGECDFIKRLVINMFDEFDVIWKERSAVA
jgi:hypothetical protein